VGGALVGTVVRGGGWSLLAVGAEVQPSKHAPVEITGLYWHFVDIVWIFLFPLLYLLGRHMQGHM